MEYLDVFNVLRDGVTFTVYTLSLVVLILLGDTGLQALL